MLIRDILDHSNIASDIRRIVTRDCSTFVEQSSALPLYKSLPSSYEDFHRVKVRLQKRKDGVSDVFEQAFGHTFSNIRQRAIFASPTLPQANETTEPFYVFPTNGYRFLYSKEVTDSSSEYKNVMETLVSNLGDLTEAKEIVTDLVKYTYSSVNLSEGMYSGAEVIFYGIPYYYAVRVSAFQTYTELVK